MELTAIEKIERLENLRDNLVKPFTSFSSDFVPWMCNAYYNYYKFTCPGTGNLFTDIPEILKYKPKILYQNNTWWHQNSVQKRINVIKKTIEDIKATL